MENGKFFTLYGGLRTPPMLYRPYGATSFTVHYHGGLRTPPMLCRPYGANHGANHNSTLYTGVDTPAYAVSPLRG